MHPLIRCQKKVSISGRMKDVFDVVVWWMCTSFIGYLTSHFARCVNFQGFSDNTFTPMLFARQELKEECSCLGKVLRYEPRTVTKEKTTHAHNFSIKNYFSSEIILFQSFQRFLKWKRLVLTERKDWNCLLSFTCDCWSRRWKVSKASFDHTSLLWNFVAKNVFPGGLHESEGVKRGVNTLLLNRVNNRQRVVDNNSKQHPMRPSKLIQELQLLEIDKQNRHPTTRQSSRA